MNEKVKEICTHELWEMENACADGICPICLKVHISTLEARVKELEGENQQLKQFLDNIKLSKLIKGQGGESPGVRRYRKHSAKGIDLKAHALTSFRKEVMPMQDMAQEWCNCPEDSAGNKTHNSNCHIFKQM